jgi:cell division protein FtsL
MKEKNDLIDAIVLFIFIAMLIAFCCYLEIQICKKNEKINILENKVEDQFYLIDALEQQEVQ